MTPTYKVDQEKLTKDLSDLGIEKGSVLMVHSSLSSMGLIEGGADTVVDSLLSSLGKKGTLVVPTFTYPADYPDSRDPDWIFDPVSTHSGMGAITNAARKRSEAFRNIHLWHSVAAIGPLANTIVNSGTSSAWDPESPMAWVFRNGGWILMLGVPYQNLTAIHVWEVELKVDYRQDYDVHRRLRQQDGSLVPLVSRVHDRKDDHPGSDFNRFGERLESQGKVQLGAVGNAVGRLFKAEDAYNLAKTMYLEDQRCFLKQTDPVTELTYGQTIQNGKGTQCVIDTDKIYETDLAKHREL